MTRSSSSSLRAVVHALTTALLLFTVVSCGGSSGVDAGRGLTLLSFEQSGVDNVALNTRLTFVFSEALDPSTISDAAIQLREGPAFGSTVPGVFVAAGSTICFEPQLAGLCDHSDSGLKPDTQYRVQCMGFPEEFAIASAPGRFSVVNEHVPRRE